MKDYITEYLKFEFAGKTKSGKTEIWNVLAKNHRDILGQIKWYGAWRQYTFRPADGTVFNTDCMREIISCINRLMDERK